MTIRNSDTSPQIQARLAGFLYLFMAPLALFGMMYVPSLIDLQDAVATAQNIKESESLFRLSIVSSLLVQVGHIWLVLLLYKLLKPVNKNVALLMVVLLLLGIPIAMLNDLNQFAVLLFLSGPSYLAEFGPVQLHNLAMLFQDLREHGVFIAQIFWGLWLFPFGYLVFKSGYIPRVLGVLLIIGGFGYLIDSFTFFLLPNSYVEVFGFLGIGELIIGLWLLIKGVNVEQREKRVLKAV